MQPNCGTPSCAIAYVRQQKAKADRKAHQEQRRKLKRRQDVMKEAQAAFNAYVRKRDENLPCISCERPASWPGQWHASHYRPAGKCAELRFDESNVHKACAECNAHKSGNLIEYRKGLVMRIGEDEVQRLEQTYEPRRWSKEELEAIKTEYRRKLRELEREAA